MALKKGVKLGLAVGLLVLSAALWVALSTSGPRTAMATDVQPIRCVCLSCQATVEIDYEAYQRASAARASADRPQRRDAAAGALRRIGRRTPVRVPCPACGAVSAVAADHCPQHDVDYPKLGPDGSRGRCPKCPPAPKMDSATGDEP